MVVHPCIKIFCISKGNLTFFCTGRAKKILWVFKGKSTFLSIYNMIYRIFGGSYLHPTHDFLHS